MQSYKSVSGTKEMLLMQACSAREMQRQQASERTAVLDNHCCVVRGQTVPRRSPEFREGDSA